MTATLFEKYETRRKRFTPGSIWIDKGAHSIKELQIVTVLDIPKTKNVYRMFCGKYNVYFKITKSVEGSGSRYSPGEYGCWNEEYMEYNYKVK